MNALKRALEFGRPVMKSTLNEYTSFHELERILEKNPLWAVSVDKKSVEKLPFYNGLDEIVAQEAPVVWTERLYEDNDLPPEEVLPTVQAGMLFEGVKAINSSSPRMRVYEKRGNGKEKDRLIILEGSNYEIQMRGYHPDQRNDIAIMILAGIRNPREYRNEEYITPEEVNEHLFESIKQRTEAFNHGQKYEFAVPLVNSDFEPAGIAVELDLAPEELRRYFLRNPEAEIILPDNIRGNPESVGSYLLPGFKVMAGEEEAGMVSRITNPKYISQGIELKLDFDNLRIMRENRNPLRGLIEYCMNKKYRP